MNWKRRGKLGVRGCELGEKEGELGVKGCELAEKGEIGSKGM